VFLVLILAFIFALAWSPWLDGKEIHDRILMEKARKDGTIVPIENLEGNEEALQELIEESRKKGVTDGVLICDYSVMMVPFGRWVASCEGGYFVTFWGGVLP